MRTAIIVACGTLLWAGCISAASFWIGVSRAGYTVAEEMPIFVAIFLLPTALAVLVKWRWL